MDMQYHQNTRNHSGSIDGPSSTEKTHDNSKSNLNFSNDEIEKVPPLYGKKLTRSHSHTSFDVQSQSSSQKMME